MTVIRWNPYREVATLQNRLNSIFQDFSRQGGGDAPTAAAFVPPVDVYQDEHKTVLKMEVPGVKQEELDIRVENNVLTVRGERKFESEEKEENFHRIERRYGTFQRSFTLPTTVDTENVKAQYDAGVLRIELQRRAESKPKQIKIAANTTSSAPQPGNNPEAASHESKPAA